jgi:biotin carboxyl carrier protein
MYLIAPMLPTRTRKDAGSAARQSYGHHRCARAATCRRCRGVSPRAGIRKSRRAWGPPACRAGAEGEEVNEAKHTEIKIPKIAGASNLTIGRWFKRVGDPVSIGEPVVEIDTYNLTHELQAPATGILSSVMVKDGGSVEPGTVIGTIDQV